MDNLSTKALYFDIPRVDEANPFGGFTVSDANDVNEPIQLNNPGINDRDLLERVAEARLRRGRRHADLGDGTTTRPRRS